MQSLAPGAAIAMALASGVEAAAGLSAAQAPCMALVDAARHLPASAWSRGEQALEPTLHIEARWSTVGGASPPDPLMPAVAASPKVREVAGDGQTWAVFVEHVPGTDLFDAFSLEGTLHCQDGALVRAHPGATPQAIPNPPTYKGGLCWTQSGDLGELEGRPVFVTHGPTDQTTSDEAIQITPWRGDGWGPACRVSLSFLSGYRLAERHCLDPDVCRLAGAAAPSMAAGFGKREQRQREPFAFDVGASPPAELQAEAARLMGDKGPVDTPEFPTFGAKADLGHPWSYSDFQFFPLVLGGHGYIGAIGHEGVGWRAGDTTLLAIYEPHGDMLRALASLIVVRSVTALKSAAVTPAMVDSGP